MLFVMKLEVINGNDEDSGWLLLESVCVCAGDASSAALFKFVLDCSFDCEDDSWVGLRIWL